MRTLTLKLHTLKAKSHHQAWPALVPKPFPLICRQAPCLLVMRTGREAGPSSLPAPLGQAVCTNLNCVSNDANSLVQKRLEAKGIEGRKSHTTLSPVLIPLQYVTSARHQIRQHLFFSLSLSAYR